MTINIMKKILAIDDQKDNLITIKAIIQSSISDCKVLTALSGKEGIKIAQEEQPDTILLDIIMPQMDGYKVCEKLKGNKLTKHIPVVMITAIETNIESRVKGLNTGADAFLSKPIDPVELSAQVNVMLRIKQVEDKLRTEKVNMEQLVEARTKDLSKTNKKLQLEITEHEQTAKTLLKESNLLTAIIDNIPLLLTRYDPDTNISYLNKEFEKVIGWKNEEIKDIDLMEKVYPDPEYRKKAAKYMQKTSIEWEEFRILSKSGKIIDSEWSNIRLEDGTQIGIGIDITGRKQADEELKKHREHLEELVKERTTHLEEKNEKLEHFNKLFVGRELRIKELKDQVKELKLK